MYPTMIELHKTKNIIELIEKLKSEGISEDKYKSYIDLFIEEKARRKGIPLTGQFELTPLCNLDCKMCYVHLNEHQFDKSRLMPVDFWKKTIRAAYDQGMRKATLTGGECLTYPGFKEVYLYLWSLGVRPGILSNGILMDKKHVEFFKEYPPKSIQITVYGSSEDAYEKVSGRRVFKIVYRNILSLKEAGLPVKLSITPNEFMRDDVQSLLIFLQGLEIPYNINANLIPPRENTGKSIHDLSIDEYVEIFRRRSEMNHKVLETVDLAELPDPGHEGSASYGFICGAGRSSFGIKYDGHMCPCLSMGEISVDTETLGFEEAWNTVNGIANSYPRPVECGECIYKSRCLPCIAMHKNALRKGHCDLRICERTRKLISAGFIPAPELKN